jgi:hypothetical protein
MKKVIASLIFAGFVSTASFAQEVKNAVFVDFGSTLVGALAGGFGIGLGYERGLSENLSVQAVFNYIGFSITGNQYLYDTNYLGIGFGAHARFYPSGTAVRGFFLDVGGDYSYISIEFGEKAESSIFNVEAKAGWKFIFGDSGGFFFEPGLRYSMSFGEVKFPAGAASIPAISGFGLWLGMGWAF